MVPAQDVVITLREAALFVECRFINNTGQSYSEYINGFTSFYWADSCCFTRLESASCWETKRKKVRHDLNDELTIYFVRDHVFTQPIAYEYMNNRYLNIWYLLIKTNVKNERQNNKNKYLNTQGNIQTSEKKVFRKMNEIWSYYSITRLLVVMNEWVLLVMNNSIPKTIKNK